MSKKTLPAIRINPDSYEKIKLAIKRYNDKNLFQTTEVEFRRMAYEYLATLIIQGKDLPFTIK